MALSHLYCGCVLQAYPDRGEFLGCGRRDSDTFLQMRLSLTSIPTTDLMVLATNMDLSLSEDRHNIWNPSSLDTCSVSVLEWLSHYLPYHFVTGRMNVEEFAIKVILKLLSSPSSPSNQSVANCTLLACVMIGVQFDKKVIVRIDKSSALPLLTDALLAKFQIALWACDGGCFSTDSTGVARRAWNLLKVICLMLEPAKRYYHHSPHPMRNLDVCKRIYSRVKSLEQIHTREFLDALRNALRFTLTAAKVSRGPADLWNSQIFWTEDSHSPEDFDWLVDYLEYIYSDDQEAAFDILVLLGVMKVRFNSAKHQFFKSLIACMGSNMPVHLRHAALCLAHSAREEMISINAIDDVNLRDMILADFSPAILTAVCPQQGALFSEDDPDYFHPERDLCYLELVFALARNSSWHSHLFKDRHICRCISIIAQCHSRPHAFYLAGILLRIAPELSSVPSLKSITGQQWWDMMRSAVAPCQLHN
ncbi:uncharacterized protein EDB93DRAFT_899282 [Suillus bovinus]|uniref:uncharacterized protein n=1 Tax=Suillus bovinus TaxID=48563 RepID=UPI001B88657E|nr:uncharacterized protein EDB93DRAFT_899282 [Suillus bovinus]KAG2132715.1 hypothetical protein EDB93DRAFT_899282 [Suillus bovinus]